MASEPPVDLEFTPKKVLSWENGFLVIGVDGELQKLSSDYSLIDTFVKPFPMSIRNAAIIGGKLIATWLDSELLLARMAAIDLNEKLVQGIERSELRVRRTIDKALHPAASTWSHVLDAEPLALDSNNKSFTFVLWKKGIYHMTHDAHEIWRQKEPQWRQLSKLPRAQETVKAIVKEDVVEIWSRGMGLNRYDIESGDLLSSDVINGEGFILDVYNDGNKYLLQLNDNEVVMLEGNNIILRARLSGPVSDAYWSEKEQGWYISGWREIVLLTVNNFEKITLDEIPVFYDDARKLALFNDAKWRQVSFGEEE
ncbi:MAG: hypothetical protein CMA30_06255 [Euryarchaeota archaeon]|nr:hypothetical protein [Euryarchaeota archaeon]|tara:strand:+ start:7328 stop:8260 length:933 start_codon:yes stop_codon:yes gene_type:complete